VTIHRPSDRLLHSAPAPGAAPTTSRLARRPFLAGLAAAGSAVLLAGCGDPRQLVRAVRNRVSENSPSSVTFAGGSTGSPEAWVHHNPKWVQFWYDTAAGHEEVNPNYEKPGPLLAPSHGGKPGDGRVTVFSYHVPVGRQAMLQSAFLFWRRDVAASNPLDVFLELGLGNTQAFHNQNGDVTNAGMDFIPPVYRGPTDNAPGQQANVQWTGPLYVPAGTIVFLNQYDVSTGGACSYKAQMQLIEYDA
jgi:hypothetical protein